MMPELESLKTLCKLGIPYRYIFDSSEDSVSGKKTCEKLSKSPDEIFKSIPLMTNRGHKLIVAVLPCNRKPDLDKIKSAVGIGCHVLGKGETEWYFGFPKGLFCPFGTCKENYEVWLDKTAFELETITVNAGGPGNYVELTVKDFETASGCKAADLHTGYTVELSGRNYALPVGAVVWKYRIKSVRSMGPMELIYEAEDIETSTAVDICELLPRYHGYKALRDADGENVNWFTYNGGNCSGLYCYYGNFPFNRYDDNISRIAYSKCLFPGSPRIIKCGEYNNTIYVVYEHKKAVNIFEYVEKYGKMSVEMADKTLMVLKRQLQEIITDDIKVLKNIRPDTVFIDEETSSAFVLPFCAPTYMLGLPKYYERYSPYDFFSPSPSSWKPEHDFQSLNRVICYALIGNNWDWSRLEQSDIYHRLIQIMPENKAKELVRSGW